MLARAREKRAAAASAPLLHYRTGQAFRAYKILQAACVALPLLEGADKFFGLLRPWNAWLAPVLQARIPLKASLLAQIVGGFEILLALAVWRAPRWATYALAVWSVLLAANQILLKSFHDLALHYAVFAVACLALARLEAEFRRGYSAVQDWER